MAAKVGPLLAILCLLPNAVQAQLDDYDKSKLVGHKEDARHVGYEAVSTKKAPLVGFEFGIGNQRPFVQVAAIRPIFKGETTDRAALGRFEDGTGKAGKKVKSPVHTREKVVAKDGYAVAKVVVQYGLWIDSIQVHFARIKGDGLDVKDTYSTNYYGSTEAKGAYTTLDSEGRLIVGVTGTQDDVKATGFGLTYAGKLPPKPQPAAPPPVPPEVRSEPPLPNSSTITLPGFDTPGNRTPSKPAPAPAPAPKPATTPKPAAPRETDAEVKARIERQNEESKKKFEKQSAEAKKQFEAFAADMKKQQAAVNQAFAAVPGWDATPHDQEAAKEFWRKAIEQAEADPNLTDEKRAEIAQFRKLLGLEPKTNWPAVAIGLVVFAAVGGAGFYFYRQNSRPALPTARRVADDVDAEPLDLDDDEELAHPRRAPRD